MKAIALGLGSASSTPSLTALSPLPPNIKANQATWNDTKRIDQLWSMRKDL